MCHCAASYGATKVIRITDVPQSASARLSYLQQRYDEVQTAKAVGSKLLECLPEPHTDNVGVDSTVPVACSDNPHFVCCVQRLDANRGDGDEVLETLWVQVVSARGLAAADVNGFSDPVRAVASLRCLQLPLNVLLRPFPCLCPFSTPM